MARWTDAPRIGNLDDEDLVLLADMSEAEGTRDRTGSVATLRAQLGVGVVVGVEQAAHGFSVGQAIRHDGSAYVAASGATEPAARVVGVVTSVLSADAFTYQSTGFVTSLSGLTPGETYYLQNDGSLGAGMGTVARPVLIAVSSSDAVLVIHLAGVSNTYYDLQMGFAGQPDAGAADVLTVARFVTVRASNPGAVHVGVPPADGPATIDIQVNGVSIGDLTIDTDGSVIWDVASDFVIPGNGLVALVAPDPADSQLADVIVALRGDAA